MKDALGSPQSVLVLGGGSEIALATVRLLAGRRTERVVLAARRPESLDEAAAAVRSAGAHSVDAVRFDATDLASHESFVDDVWGRFGDFDLVLFAFGVLGDQTTCETDPAAAVEVIQTNFTGAASVAIPIAGRMLAQGHGSIVVLSSIAAERARRANFVYGSSKAGMDQFFQGLGDMLHGRGVHVMVVRPGFVRTKMTTGMKAAPFATTPDEVAPRSREASNVARRRSGCRGRCARSLRRCTTSRAPSTASCRSRRPVTDRPTVAAFDFDGTITVRDTMSGFLREVAGTRALLTAAGLDLPRLLLAASGHGSRDEGKGRLLMRLFGGRATEEVVALGRRYGARLVAREIRSEMRARLRWHAERGHRVVIVSASLDTYLDEVGRLLGVDSVICTKLAVGADGAFTGRMDGGNCRGAEKARRLTAHLASLGGGTLGWAYGDSPGDREMLAMAENPVWVTKRGGLGHTTV